jgi:hypothetical protein
MSRRSDDRLGRRLRAVPAPDESAAEERAWGVVRSAYAARPARAHRRAPARLAIVLAVTVLAGVLVLTPAGATVHRWIEQTLGVRHARPALFSLPAQGRLLVAGPAGTWTVAADGSRRRLGPWRQATWSSHGLYVAVASGNELRAIDPRGVTHWSIARPAIRFPRWFAPDGYRIAYLSGSTLRVVAGDGTADHELAGGVAGVAPAWRPGHRYQLAYATRGATVIVRDADTRQTILRARLPLMPRLIRWSADGRRLLVLTRRSALVYSATGQLALSLPTTGVRDAALSPAGSTLALLTDRDVELVALGPRHGPARRLFSGEGLRQLAWSPDGRWLLVAWPAADQWVFVRVGGRPRLIAVARIAQQFGGGRGATGFPQLEGWCCTAQGGAT